MKNGQSDYVAAEDYKSEHDNCGRTSPQDSDTESTGQSCIISRWDPLSKVAKAGQELKTKFLQRCRSMWG